MDTKMTKKIALSMMCADYRTLPALLDTFAETGIEYLHIDIMDGVFVKNFTLGTDYCKRLRAMTDIPLDIHMMVTEPETKIGWFEPKEGEYVSIHYEATNHLQRALAEIKKYGAKPMVALNPATPLCVMDYILDDIDAVLLMTVNPGFAGQKIVPKMFDKVRDCRKYLDERGYNHVEIEVDGNVNFPNTVKLAAAGADIYVAGTSSVFMGDDITGNIAKMRRIFNGEDIGE